MYLVTHTETWHGRLTSVLPLQCTFNALRVLLGFAAQMCVLQPGYMLYT